VEGVASSFLCELCWAGSFQPNYGSSAWFLFQEGSFSTTIRSLIMGTCQHCPAGTYHSKMGAKAHSDCIRCLAGLYSSVHSARSSNSCPHCSQGRYQDIRGARSKDSFYHAQRAFMQAGVSLSEVSFCSSCAQGKYQSNKGRQADRRAATALASAKRENLHCFQL
jgi:hypothetical protein